MLEVRSCNVLNHIVNIACFSLHYPLVTCLTFITSCLSAVSLCCLLLHSVLCIRQPSLAPISIKCFIIAFCSKLFNVIFFNYNLDYWCPTSASLVLCPSILCLIVSISSSSNQCFSSICLLLSYSCCSLTSFIPLLLPDLMPSLYLSFGLLRM